MVNTTDASVSTVIDHTYVENMPLNGRSFQDLILLTPGIVTQTPQLRVRNCGLGETANSASMASVTESNYYTVDGVSANWVQLQVSLIYAAGASGSVPAATALGTTQALVSVDDLQDFAYRARPTRPNMDIILAGSSRSRRNRVPINGTARPTTICGTALLTLRTGSTTILA